MLHLESSPFPSWIYNWLTTIDFTMWYQFRHFKRRPILLALTIWPLIPQSKRKICHQNQKENQQMKTPIISIHEQVLLKSKAAWFYPFTLHSLLYKCQNNTLMHFNIELMGNRAGASVLFATRYRITTGPQGIIWSKTCNSILFFSK